MLVCGILKRSRFFSKKGREVGGLDFGLMDMCMNE